MFSARTAAVVRAAVSKSSSSVHQDVVLKGCGATVGSGKNYFSSIMKGPSVGGRGGFDHEEEMDALTVIEKKKDQLAKEAGKHAVWQSPVALPAPHLPEDIHELKVLDGADLHTRTKFDGSDRFVIIRQCQKNVKQAPMNPEKRWKICFTSDGTKSETWQNSLMGWTSSADPYMSEPPLYFENAKDAVYFAKKRGYRFLVKEPIRRRTRSDSAQYQDNFLPQDVAAKVTKEGPNCDHWHRQEGCASHYFRPLKYHGDGVVRQHGPEMHADIAPSVKGIYKMR